MKNFFRTLKMELCFFIKGYPHVIFLLLAVPIGIWAPYLFHKTLNLDINGNYGIFLTITYVWFWVAYIFIISNIANSIRER